MNEETTRRLAAIVSNWRAEAASLVAEGTRQEGKFNLLAARYYEGEAEGFGKAVADIREIMPEIATGNGEDSRGVVTFRAAAIGEDSPSISLRAVAHRAGVPMAFVTMTVNVRRGEAWGFIDIAPRLPGSLRPPKPSIDSPALDLEFKDSEPREGCTSLLTYARHLVNRYNSFFSAFAGVRIIIEED